MSTNFSNYERPILQEREQLALKYTTSDCRVNNDVTL